LKFTSFVGKFQQPGRAWKELPLKTGEQPKGKHIDTQQVDYLRQLLNLFG